MLYVPSFFLRALRAFIFLRVLRASSFLRVLRAYILFMYILTKLTQINEIHILMKFTLIKYFHFSKTRVIFCMSFSNTGTLSGTAN